MIKKTILTTLTFLLTLGLYAQNGGFSNENSVCKLEWVGIINNHYVVKVTNKQTCDDSMMVIYQGQFVQKLVPAGTSDTFHLPQANACIILAKAGTACSTVDYGTVEINVCQILPVKLSYFQVRKLNATEIEVVFEVTEISGVNHINFQVSPDGKKFKTVDLILTDDITPNKRITKKIKI